MMSNEVKTAGETADPKSLIDLVVENLVNSGVSFKSTGGAFVSKEDTTKFIGTLFALANVERYHTMVTVDQVAYPISSYAIDARLGGAFAMPRQIMMPGTSPYLKDLREHEECTVSMTPAEFVEYQYKFFANFKQVPNLQPVDEFIRPINIGEVTEIYNGKSAHIDDVCAAKSLPVKLLASDVMFEKDYFEYPLETVVKQIVINFYTNLKSKG